MVLGDSTAPDQLQLTPSMVHLQSKLDTLNNTMQQSLEVQTQILDSSMHFKKLDVLNEKVERGLELHKHNNEIRALSAKVEILSQQIERTLEIQQQSLELLTRGQKGHSETSEGKVSQGAYRPGMFSARRRTEMRPSVLDHEHDSV